MKCDEIQELLCLYWDLPEDDPRRFAVEQHKLDCADCAEEFSIWEESIQLIQTSGSVSAEAGTASAVSQNVMNRIYSEDTWRIPVTARVYSFSYKVRRNLTVVIAFCLALFLFSFLYTLTGSQGKSGDLYSAKSSGITDVASALGSDEASGDNAIHTIPLASISDDPVVLKISVLPTYPDYYVVLSILGMISTLLIMNWLSRIRA